MMPPHQFRDLSLLEVTFYGIPDPMMKVFIGGCFSKDGFSQGTSYHTPFRGLFY
jgi:hypothetical protein